MIHDEWTEFKLLNPITILGYKCNQYELRIYQYSTGDRILGVIPLNDLKYGSREKFSRNDALKPNLYGWGFLHYCITRQSKKESIDFLKNLFTIIPSLTNEQNEKLEKYMYIC